VAVGDRRVDASIRIGGATNRSEGVEIMEDLFTVAETALDAATKQGEGVAVVTEVGA